jgi:hypothetical protein
MEYIYCDLGNWKAVPIIIVIFALLTSKNFLFNNFLQFVVNTFWVVNFAFYLFI